MPRKMLCLLAVVLASPAAAFEQNDHPCSQPDVTAEVVSLMHQRLSSASSLGKVFIDVEGTTFSIDDVRTSVISETEAQCKSTLHVHVKFSAAGGALLRPGLPDDDTLSDDSELDYSVEITDAGKLLVTLDR